jgi:hypothetical protein
MEYSDLYEEKKEEKSWAGSLSDVANVLRPTATNLEEIWSGWLRKKGQGFGRNTNVWRLFILQKPSRPGKDTFSYWAPPSSSAADIEYAQGIIPSLEQLNKLQFVKRGDILIKDVIHIEDVGQVLDDQVTLQMLKIHTEKRVYELCAHKRDDMEKLFQALRAHGKVCSTAKIKHSYENPVTVKPKEGTLKAPPIVEHKEDALESKDNYLDEVKVATMYKLVEDVKIDLDGADVDGNCLYLTNNQAAKFGEENMKKCLHALELGEPKCLIRLAKSLGTAQTYKVHIEHTREAKGQFHGTTRQTGCEIDTSDSFNAGKQLVIFFKTCLLPLAKKTRALILINAANDCALVAALEEVFLPEIHRLGKNCPFQILAWALSHEVHYKAVKGEGIAGDIARKCGAWRSRLPIISEHYAKRDASEWSTCDLTSAATHFIIFEALDPKDNRGVDSRGASKTFRNLFTSVISANLPSIIIASCGDQTIYDTTGKSSNGLQFADLARRQIPILLLDVRMRAFSSHENIVTDTEQRTHLCKQANQFPQIAIESLKDYHFQKYGRGLTLQSRYKLFEVATKLIEESFAQFILKNAVDYYEISDLAFLHSAITIGGAQRDEHKRTDPLWQRILELKQRKAGGANVVGNGIPLDLCTKATDYVERRRRALGKFNCLEFAKYWLENHDQKYDYLNQDCVEYIEQLQVECENIKANNNWITEIRKKQWSDTFDVLASPSTFSASIYDVTEIRRIFGTVALVDRLPNNNSLESLLVLADAWDHVDLYHHLATLYKYITKTVYMLLLLLGISVVVISLGEYLSEESTRFAILGLSLCGSILACYIGFVNPAQKWMHLRGAALEIESEIWLFRTRSGEYRNTDASSVTIESFDNRADKHLKLRIDEVKNRVIEGGEIRDTGIFGYRYSPNLHNQRRPGAQTFGSDGGGDGSTSNWLGVWFPCLSPVIEEALEVAEAIEETVEKTTLTAEEARKKHEPRDTPTLHDRLLHRLQRENRRLPDSGLVSLCEALDLIEESTRHEVDLDEPEDTHFKPAQPTEYCRFRVQKMIEFYKTRIPVISRVKYIGQTFLVLGSVAGVILASVNQERWAAAVSIFTSSVTAWLEFSGTHSKQTRYSTTVKGLTDVLNWWDSLQPIEKSAVENVDKLATSTEDILRSEQQAWRSTSQVAKLLAKETDDNSQTIYGGA